MTLYEIDKAILDCIDAETGEIVDEDMLDSLQMERQTKIENVGCWIKNLEADVKALKDEMAALKIRKDSKENRIENLKAWLKDALDGTGFETAKVKISYRKSDAVEIADGAKIPEEYLKYSEPTADKVELKKALKAGKQIDGVALVERQNISIK
jgi:hypothetical protein